MTVEIETRGGPELIKALHALEQAMHREVLVTALVVGAEPMRAHAAALAPRSPKRSPHLADEIVIAVPSESKLERRGQFDVVVEMGPAKRPHDHFYGYFQEYGTLRHRAQPFMRPAFDAQAQRSLDITLQTLWVVLQRTAERNKAA